MTASTRSRTDRRTSRPARMLRMAAIAGALSLTAALAGCSAPASGSAPEGTPQHPIRLGVVGASEPYWQTYEQAVEAAGISLEIVDFAEYSQPNPALSAGEIDLNQFQHVLYLAQYNVSAGEDLVPIGSTAIYPLGLYSQKYQSAAEIPAGSEVAIPNDESNQARALLVLQSAGLITLKGGGSPYSTPDEIDAAASKVTVRPVEASLTGTVLPDVAASIINNDFVADAGLTPEQAIATDDPSKPSAQPYINIFAARSEDAANPTYLKLVEIYQNDQSVLDGVVEAAGGAAVTLKTPTQELVESLTTTQGQYQARKS